LAPRSPFPCSPRAAP